MTSVIYDFRVKIKKALKTELFKTAMVGSSNLKFDSFFWQMALLSDIKK